MRECLGKEQFAEQYASVFEGDESWRKLATPKGQSYAWEAESTYVRNPPYFEGMGNEPGPLADIVGVRCLAKLGDVHHNPLLSTCELEWLALEVLSPKDSAQYAYNADDGCPSTPDLLVVLVPHRHVEPTVAASITNRDPRPSTTRRVVAARRGCRPAATDVHHALLGRPSSELHWRALLLEQHGDESAAFDAFFELLDAFRR